MPVDRVDVEAFGSQLRFDVFTPFEYFTVPLAVRFAHALVARRRPHITRDAEARLTLLGDLAVEFVDLVARDDPCTRLHA